MILSPIAALIVLFVAGFALVALLQFIRILLEIGPVVLVLILVAIVLYIGLGGSV